MDKDLLKIINNYGVLHQLKHFQTEVYELNEAILYKEQPNDLARPFRELSARLNNKNSPYIEHIAEEIADVEVMLLQFKEYYHIDGKDILEIMERKIKRQLERMENEQ